MLLGTVPEEEHTPKRLKSAPQRTGAVVAVGDVLPIPFASAAWLYYLGEILGTDRVGSYWKGRTVRRRLSEPFLAPPAASAWLLQLAME